MKPTSLTSATVASAAHRARIRTPAAGGPATVHAYVTDAPVVVSVVSSLHVVPPFRLTSKENDWPTPPLWVNRSDCVVPTRHATAVFGATKVTVGAMSVNGALTP